MKAYIDHLYDNGLEGYIQILNIGKNEKVEIYNTEYNGIKEIVHKFKGREDTFITPNSFYIPVRKNQNIRHFRALFIDIDINPNWSKNDAIYELYILADMGEIPRPTMIVDSGRGIHAYWRIENAPMGALYTWQELEDYLYKKLKYIGADIKATDSSRLLRLPNTINSRNKRECKVVLVEDNKYSMYDLREKYLNYKKGKNKGSSKKSCNSKGTKKTNKVKHYFNSYYLHLNRAADIETLCKLRNYDMEGYRNMALHCWIYWRGIYVRDEQQLQDMALEFNNKFKVPQKETEVKATVKSTMKAIEKFIDYEQGLRSGQDKRVSKNMRERGGYWYKNSTLIERLGITKEEQRHLRTIIGTEEKYRRNNLRRRKERRNKDGLTAREQQKKETINNVLDLKRKGLNQTEIAKELGITQARVSQVLNGKY